MTSEKKTEKRIDLSHKETGGALCLRATITAPLPPAKSGKKNIYRALAVGSDNRQILLISHVKIDARPGDEIFAEGRYAPHHGKNLPQNFIIGGGKLASRMEALLASGAAVKGAGGKRHEIPAPFYAVLKNFAPAGSVVEAAGSHAAIVRRGTDSKDPILKWICVLMDGVSGTVPISIIDPKAYLVEYGPGRVTHARRVAEEKRLRGALQREVHASKRRFVTEVYAGGMRRGRALSSMRGLKGPVRHGVKQHLVMPEDPYRSASRVWSGFSGLPCNAFAPKRLPDMETYRYFVAAHEVAHALQTEFGMPFSSGSTFRAQLNECFADAFAILASLQKTGDDETLRSIADYRHQKIYSSRKLGHYTGPAADAALELGLKLKAEGKLETLSAPSMLRMATEISREHSLSRSDYARLIRMRHHFFLDRKLYLSKRGAIHMPRLIKLLHSRGRARALEAFGDEAWRVERALEGLARTSFTPRQLAHPANRARALKIYEDDLADSLFRAEDAGHRRGMIDIERRSFVWLGQIRRRRGRWKFEPGETEMLDGRAAILNRARARVEYEAKKSTEGDEAAFRQPIVTLSSEPQLGYLEQALKETPKMRLKTYRQALGEEIRHLKKMTACPDDGERRKAARDAMIKRHAYAYAMRIHARDWKAVLKLEKKNPAFRRHIAAIANHRSAVIPQQQGALRARLKKLRAQKARM